MKEKTRFMAEGFFTGAAAAVAAQFGAETVFTAGGGGVGMGAEGATAAAPAEAYAG
jgi:hypothetical protein